MPAPDMLDDTDVGAAHENKSEKDKSSKGGKGSGSSKVKDLSHVPCKFFRVGSCTAGSSCPFSHHVLEPGQQKDVCAWFVKGNCKFGHKCALAHVLPGQSMSMDRRNKKAAQLAAGQTGGKDKDKDAPAPSRSGDHSSKKSAQGAGVAQSRSGLLSGSTAPTRVLSSGTRPPLAISKAVPAPAEPAPALKDADFTSFDTFAKVVAEGTGEKNGGVEEMFQDEENGMAQKFGSPSIAVSPPADTNAFPVSTPSQPKRFTGRHGSSSSIDFGPVGSPPRVSPTNPIRINGFSPGTSPRDAVQNAQPLTPNSTFSAPGPGPSQSLFMHDLKSRSGLAASLGAGPAFNVGSLPVLSRNTSSVTDSLGSFAESLDDDDMEEFVPSSLKDLLTPEEQNRRMSRTSSAATGAVGIGPTISHPSVQDNRHRHSRSVPAPSILQDIRSIWADSNGELPAAQKDVGAGFGVPQGVGGLGTPSSFKSGAGLHPGFDADGPSPSMLNPTNASAAFLPGLHHYMSRAPMGAVRAVSQGTVHQQHRQGGPAGVGQGDVNGLSASPSRLGTTAISMSMSTNAHTHSFDAFSSSPSNHTTLPPGRPIPSTNTQFLASEHLSPSSRALQAHAPGQSLPQGLAAGYSRIHLQPPPPTAPSPSAFSPGSSGLYVPIVPIAGAGDFIGNSDWLSVVAAKHRPGSLEQSALASAASPPTEAVAGAPFGEQSAMTSASLAGGGAGAGASEADLAGLASMFSHLSYSSVAARGGLGHGHGLGHTHGPGVTAASVPLSMSRRPSGRGWNSHLLSSPLSGPVLTNDDDELFPMDEEK